MATFTASVTSEGDLDASQHEVWQVLTDPAAVADMTPLLRRIDVEGEHWIWRMTKVSALGVDLTPVFTERMTLDPESRIDFAHDPTPGSDERIGVTGSYALTDTGDGVHLAITLSVEAKLPLPRAASPAVTRVMKQTMMRMGDRFAANLVTRLNTTRR